MTGPPEHSRRLPLLRRLLYGASVAGLALAIAILALRISADDGPVRSATGDGAEAPRRLAGTPDTLVFECVVNDPAECEAITGARIRKCLRPSCDDQITAQGFFGPADRVISDHRPPDTHRIMVFGGSTSIRWQCSWPGLLEERLTQRAAREGLSLRFEVINLALPGAGSKEMWERYRALASSFEIDAVILGEEVNDLAHCASLGDGSLGAVEPVAVLDRYLRGEATDEELAAISPWFERHLEVFATRRREQTVRSAAQALREALLRGSVDPLALAPDEWEAACRRSTPLPANPGESILADYEDGWIHTRRNWMQILDATRARGAFTQVVSTVPHDLEDWLCPEPVCPLAPDLDDWHAYFSVLFNPAIRSFAEEEDLLLADLERLVDDFATGETGKSPLFLEWMHPSCDGHRLIASAYADLLWPSVRAAHGAQRRRAEGSPTSNP